jgi:hypothetical protein
MLTNRFSLSAPGNGNSHQVDRIRGALTTAMHQAGFSDDEQTAIAAGNCLRLLGVS